tara:strand:- start:2627 stop:4351 length:1725 start_codon:yes stop_codon:yes gene_type:complete
MIHSIIILLIVLIIFVILNNLLTSNENFTSSTNKIYNYLIIGSGPAGLQTAYFLKKYNEDYIIIEKSNNSGSFFNKFPIHRKLISINKVNTGSDNKEFNLRHDWNSLLSDDDSLLFKNYSQDYYPNADVMVNYLNDFKNKNDLNVLFNTNVIKINKINDIFEIQTSKGTFKCKNLIVATGLFKSNKSTKFDDVILYSDLKSDKEKFKNKNILIIGQGNSAFETANYLNDVAAFIHVVGKGALKFAWQTHYPGHLRAINNDFLDTYQLKSQNGLINFKKNQDIMISKKNNKYYLFGMESENSGENNSLENQSEKSVDNNSFDLGNINSLIEDLDGQKGYDYVIDCTGFNIDNSIFGNIKPLTNGKVPLLKSNFESKNVSHLYFAGVLSQEISYKKSSSAFVHGFRYLIKSMVKINTNNIEKIKINSQSELVNKILDRLNNSSGLYQMFNCLCDIVIIENNTIYYIEELPIKYVLENYVTKYNKIIIIKLDYGNYGGTIENKNDLGNSSYVFGVDRAIGSSKEKAHLSDFIHPIFILYINHNETSTFHLSENLLFEFKLKDTHIKPLQNFIKKSLS